MTFRTDTCDICTWCLLSLNHGACCSCLESLKGLWIYWGSVYIARKLKQKPANNEVKPTPLMGTNLWCRPRNMPWSDVIQNSCKFIFQITLDKSPVIELFWNGKFRHGVFFAGCNNTIKDGVNLQIIPHQSKITMKLTAVKHNHYINVVRNVHCYYLRIVNRCLGLHHGSVPPGNVKIDNKINFKG